MKNLKDKKGFTIIELIVVIAILGILVLLAGPKLLGYVEKAELARIQHDVKVMEDKMAEVLTTDNKFNDWQNNGKDLGRVVMRKELYEKQGVAKFIDWEHLSARADKGVNQLVNKNNELGVGGDLIELDDKYSTYKIIPKEYSSKINTKLKGTFYVNSLGKVYYEHDKPLTKAIEKEVLACVAPETLNYDFRIIDGLGTIVNWSGTETHLVIPASFKMSEGGKEWCEPVRVIGAGAFQHGNFEKVTIPQSVEEIEDEAFRDGKLTEIEIPHSVINIGDNAFTGNPATSSGGSGGLRVIVKGSSDGRNISDSAFGGSDYTYSPVTAKDLDIITKIKTDSSGNKSVSIIGKTGISSGGSSSGGSYSNTVINIPKELEINGELLPVTEIDSGAFQGSGLIDVIMPEGLLYIHDYAFAGNQLIRVVIPNSVISVGNYAFAYNEIAEKPTIDHINILDKFIGDFSYVNNDGNIGQSVITIDLNAHIFIISSMGNHIVEDVGANPVEDVGANPVEDVGANPEQPEDNNDDDSNDEDVGANPEQPEDNNDDDSNDEKIEELIKKGYIPIATAEELNNVRINEERIYGKGTKWEGKYTGGLTKNYIQVANVDLSGYSEGLGWVPIGNYNSRFTGSFNGNGYKITGLTIDRSETNNIGLFGYTDGATIENVALEDVNIKGEKYTGGLVGRANSSTITNSYVTGSITSEKYTGGLVGYAVSSTIENSYATGSVTNSYANGEGDYTGGLVGYTDESTNITNSYATGEVTGKKYTGGLVGKTWGSTITNSYATGKVTGAGYNTGGLVGEAYSSTIIKDSYATGEVTGGGYYTGGLVGSAYSSTIENSYATGKVTGSEDYRGGLVGYAYSTTIENSYATGEVTGRDYPGDDTGGLVGYAYSSTIENSYATGSVSGGNAGGLVGYAYSLTVTNSYWDTETTGQSKSAGGEGKTTSQMKDKNTYTNWDFSNIWQIDEDSYPTLRQP